MKTVKTMWTVQSALNLIRLIYPVALRSGYNLHLGGSVMYEGQTSNDLDIIAIRRPNVLKSNINKTVDELGKLGFSTDTFVGDIPYRQLWRLKSGAGGKFKEFRNCKVDLIVLDLMGDLAAQTEVYAFNGSGEDAEGLKSEIMRRERKRYEDLLARVDRAAEVALFEMENIDAKLEEEIGRDWYAMHRDDC